jgi:hypothetical protein
VQIFSYPNGERGEFGEIDKEALRAEGVVAAVTTISGSNRFGGDPYELRRYPMTLDNRAWRFRAEVTGFAHAVRTASEMKSAWTSRR